MKIIITQSEEETRRRAKEVAQEVLRAHKRKDGALIVGLRGELGSGKTMFTQGFAEFLGVKEVVSSPTFLIIKKYKIQTAEFSTLFHIDCYRLQDESDILALEWKQIVENPEHIVLVEWPEIIEAVLPKHTRMTFFEVVGQNERRITVQ